MVSVHAPTRFPQAVEPEVDKTVCDVLVLIAAQHKDRRPRIGAQYPLAGIFLGFFESQLLNLQSGQTAL